MTDQSPHTFSHPAPAASDLTTTLPMATLKPERRISIAWLLPLAALIFAGWLGWRAWSMRGVTISVQLDDGHGLQAGDAVRYRGINVGVIDSVMLQRDGHAVLINARLSAQSERLARAGSRFWVVRPQFRLTRIEGLDTLIGPRFLAVLPGSDGDGAATQRDFIGIAEPPVIEAIQANDLEIILNAPQRGSLHAGAPISYRQTRVGTVLSVGLASDGSAVEARAIVEGPYVQLIRPKTRFWDVGGLQAKLGLTGVSIEIDSAESLLMGGVALATPPPNDAGGDVVRTGHRFTLDDKPEKEWLQWQPMVAIGSSLLPPGISPPSPLRAGIGWKQGRWIKTSKTRRGWVIQTTDGLLGPADLLKPGEKADRDTVVLEVAGATVPLEAAPLWERAGLAMIKADVNSVRWPVANFRHATGPEECLVITDSTANPLPLSASHLTVIGTGDEQSWQIDPAISIDETMHGACVVSRSDGKILGLLTIDGQSARVALVPQGVAPP